MRTIRKDGCGGEIKSFAKEAKRAPGKSSKGAGQRPLSERPALGGHAAGENQGHQVHAARARPYAQGFSTRR